MKRVARGVPLTLARLGRAAALAAVAIALGGRFLLAATPEEFADRALWTGKDPGLTWAKDVIERSIALGIFRGSPAAGGKVEFRPRGTITRAEFAAILSRAIGAEGDLAGGERAPFRDLPGNAWYAPYVVGLYKANVVRLSDRPDGNFQADAAITRVEIAAWSARAAAAKGALVGPSPLGFTDAAWIASYWRLDVGQAISLGVVKGYEDGTFRPQATATRAEAAAMILRLIDAINARQGG